MGWQQIYDPLGNAWLSTLLAAFPVVVMLGGLAWLRWQAPWAAAAGLAAAAAVAVGVYGMPGSMAASAALLGALTGLLPIGWIVLNILFLHQLTERDGSFRVLQRSIAGLTADGRLQLLLIAFAFGAFFEGAAGFGTPVAVTAALLIGLGFTPLAASGLSLIANTAPVAYGALGTPILTLAKTHGYDAMAVSAMVGRQLPFFSVLVPFWLLLAFCGWRGTRAVWPAALVAGVAFAVPQFLVSNYIGPELVDVIAAVCSLGSLALFLRWWRPVDHWTPAGEAVTATTVSGVAGNAAETAEASAPVSTAEVRRAWAPWAILTVFVFCWGLPVVKTWLNGWFAPKFALPGLHHLVSRMPPVVPEATSEAAEFTFNLLSASGTGILLAALVGGRVLGFGWRALGQAYAATLWRVRLPLLTIALMLALGTLTRYSGLDTTLGLAFAHTGVFYPFFGTLLGWLGVALTGSDTSSNVLFGGLQKVAAGQLGLSENLMGAANSAGGVMGKMVDAQSIVVAASATGYHGREGEVLRYVFFHSIALASLVGLLVTLQAY
ncbi:MAG: hypothetical protein RJB26_1501, partial [Pseudomonadota bacterium]